MNETIAQYTKTSPRRAIIYSLVIILVVVFALSWLASYFGSGKVIISTNVKDNSIEIKKIKENKTVAQSKGSLEAKLPVGEYVAFVSDRRSSNKQIIHIKAHHSATYNINIQKLIDPEPVLPFGAYGIVADSATMFYADMRDNLLYKLDSQNPPHAVSSDITFSNIKWQNVGYGVALSKDEKSLYSIRGGVLAPISLPFGATQLYFDLSPDGHLLVANNKSIYSKSVDGGFNKIFTADKDDTITSLGASNNNVLVRFEPGESSGDESKTIVLDTRGSIVAKVDDFSAYTYRWSPDGKILAVTNDSGTILYDTHLKQIDSLPDINVLGLTWLKDGTLLYGVGANLFGYNVNDKLSYQVSTAALGDSVSGVYISQDRSQLYIVSESANASNRKIVRANLNKGAPDYAKQLGIFLPLQLNDCYVSYINFVQPLAVGYPVIGASGAACVDEAKKALAADTFDITKINFVVAPTLTVTD
jgi:hypothetical protein